MAAIPRPLRKAAFLLHRVGLDPALVTLLGCEVVFLVAGEQPMMASSSFVGGKSEALASAFLLGQELRR